LEVLSHYLEFETEERLDSAVRKRHAIAKQLIRGRNDNLSHRAAFMFGPESFGPDNPNVIANLEARFSV
jgi:hypothetical protein